MTRLNGSFQTLSDTQKGVATESHIGEVGRHLLDLALVVLPGDVVAGVYLLAVEEPAVDVFVGLGNSLVGFAVDNPYPLELSCSS